MSDIPEAIGGAIEGAAYARAVEPGAGGGKLDASGHFAEGACLNCGAALTGAYCTACGQKAHVHRTISAFMHDLMHGALHFEGKIWTTLPMLAIRPGELTRRYIAGERAKFVSPMALFLFAVFLMFAVFQAVGLTAPTDLNGDTVVQVRQGLEAQKDRIAREIAQAEQELAEPDLDADARAALEEEIAQLREESSAVDEAANLDFLDNNANSGVSMNFTGLEAIDNGLLKKWRDNPSLMLYKLQANSYKFSWLLIPISLPFVWLLFLWRPRFKGYDHAIFVTYSLSFMSLLFVVLSVLRTAGVGAIWLLTAVSIIAPIHIYKQLRGAYGLTRFSAFWRLLALLFLINFIIVLFLNALLLLGAF